MLRGAEFLVVTVLPGAWITFGLPLRQLSFWARLLAGILLSPLVIGLQFFPLRLLGASFAQTALILVLINLPALYLIWRHGRRMQVPDHRTWLTWSIVVLISIACLSVPFAHPEQGMYLGHPWVYSEPVYSLAKGELDLENPDFAGTSMAYPVWGSLIHQAILSYLLDSPPMWNFIWSNLVYLIVAYGFILGMVEEVGGGWIAKWSSGVWLLLSANSVGHALQKLLPRSLTGAIRIWGDPRYTPWAWKFFSFNTMPLILGLCLAIAFLLIRHSPEKLTKDMLFLLFLLLSSVGVFYPILYPAACALLGAKALAIVLERSGESRGMRFKQITTFAVVLFLSAVVTYANYKFFTRERIVFGMVQISNFRAMARKAIEFAVVTSPLLAGMGIAFRDFWKKRQSACVVLAVGALGSLVLNVLFSLPYWDNEYKFMFTAIICLAPFASLATEHLWKKLGPAKAFPVAGLALLLFVATFVHQVSTWNWEGTKPRPRTDESSFYLRLDPSEPWSGIYEALRQKTPQNTILIIQGAEWHSPTFTSRSLYVAYSDLPFVGISQQNDILLAYVRGLGENAVKERQQTQVDLFESTDDARRAQALSRILQLKRPLAIVLQPRHAALFEWLKANTQGSSVHEENGLTLWLIQR